MNKKYWLIIAPILFFVIWILIGNFLICPMSPSGRFYAQSLCTSEEATYASLTYSLLFILPLVALLIANKKWIKIFSAIVVILFLIISFGPFVFNPEWFGGGNYLIRFLYLGVADTNKLLALAIYTLPVLGFKLSM